VHTANAVPVVATPLAYGIGLIILVVVVFTESWAGSLVTVAHEGGHIIFAVLTFRGFSGLHLHDGGGGKTTGMDTSWGVGDLLLTFAATRRRPCSGWVGLARRTLIPRIVWHAIWIAIAVFCLLRGGRLLLYR
jgi:hypothetical protein